MKISTDTFSINRAFDEVIKDFRPVESIPLSSVANSLSAFLLGGGGQDRLYIPFHLRFSKMLIKPLERNSFRLSISYFFAIPFHLHFSRGNEGKTFMKIDNVIPNYLIMLILLFFMTFSMAGFQADPNDLPIILFGMCIILMGCVGYYFKSKKILMACLTRILCLDNTAVITRVK